MQIVHGHKRATESKIHFEPEGSGSSSFVAMMQTADLWNLNNPSYLHRLNRPSYRSVFAQREVSPRTLVILEVGSENSPETGFIQHNDVIQTLAANRSDQSLDVGVLPG